MRKEEIEVRFGAARAADPDRPSAIKVTDDDPGVMALPDGDLAHTDRSGRGQTGAYHLLLPVDRVEGLDGTVVDPLRLGDRRVRHLAAERADVYGEALRDAWIRRQPVKAFYEHAVAPWTGDPPAFELDVDTGAASREVARAAAALVVPAAASVATL